MVGHSQRAYQSISPLISSSQPDGCSPPHSCQSTLGKGRHCLSYLQFQCGNPSAVLRFCWKTRQVPLWLPLRNRTSFCFVLFLYGQGQVKDRCFLWGFFFWYGTFTSAVVVSSAGQLFQIVSSCVWSLQVADYQSGHFFFFKSSNTNLLFPYPKRKGIFTSKK